MKAVSLRIWTLVFWLFYFYATRGDLTTTVLMTLVFVLFRVNWPKIICSVVRDDEQVVFLLQADGEETDK